jgi:dipeptidyl aminopeptidase/acylaminoacyl peptidase
MRVPTAVRYAACLFGAAFLIPNGALAQEKPTIPPADYGKFEILGFATLSPDGTWLAYGVRHVNDESELRITSLALDTTWTEPWASNPTFTANNRWLAWTVGVSEDERERLEKKEQPVRNGAGLLNLATGERRRFEKVERFAFDRSGRFLALVGYAPEEPKGKGADLRLIALDSGDETTFGNVSDFAWSDSGALLALSLATGEGQGNGVQVFDAGTGRLTSLDASPSSYVQLSWRDDAADLAVLRSVDSAGSDNTAYQVLAWRGVDRGEATRFALVPGDALADSLEVSRHRAPEWSDDGSRVALGLRPVQPKDEGGPAPGDSAAADSTVDDLPTLEIWHTSDVRLFPEQRTFAARDESRTLLAVWDLESGRVMQVGTHLLARAELLHDWRYGVERDASPYPWGTMFGRPYRDVWTVDLFTGQRERALERVRYSWDSPGGRYLLTFDGKDYWSYDVASRERVNLTASLPPAFADTLYDTPTDVLPPHGVGGWLEDDRAVFVYDQFDVWRLDPTGSGGVRLTDGARDSVVYRLRDLDSDADAFDPDEPLYFSIRGEWTEQQGYARLDPGGSRVRRLLMADKRVTSLQKADSAAVYLFRQEDRDDAPDYFVADADLAPARQVTHIDPFAAEYAWGRPELFEFESEMGTRLQAGLLYPANHDPSRRYPMIVYTYEILSPQIHIYEPPSERDYYNFTTWTQQGYFVLLPDIVYKAREPGLSALAAVRPAVHKVVEMGLADSTKVGLIGHSWGGYQATFLPTRTNIFAASVAGAPLTDFVSFMGALHWNPGIAELSHWETGQARMQVPYWEDPEAHHRASPIHKVQDLETPLLMAFGNEDGTVDWDQGTEFYNYARRAGKQMVLLVYEGEDHGFRKKANQIDYHRRILEWFGHYLKGEPAPAWITNGISIDDLEKEKKRVAEGSTPPTATDAGQGHARE